jgi:ABC-2 type transport system permease protein
VSLPGVLGRAARAYPTLLRVGFAEAVAYRAEMIVWLLSSTMPLVSLALWSAVAASGPVRGFTQHGLDAYFLADLVVRQLTGSWLVWEMNQEIRTGTLSRRLLKPLHPLVAYSAENLAALPMRALLSSPIALLALVVIGRASALTSPLMLLLWVTSIAGAWLINFFAMATIGALAFFLESSLALFELWLVAFMILSGYLIPLDLFPPGLRALTYALPFRYTIALPVEILTGLSDVPRAVRGLAAQWAYVAAFGAAAMVAWRAGIRRFSAYGG